MHKWLRLHTFIAGGMGWIPGQETKSHRPRGAAKKRERRVFWKLEEEKYLNKEKSVESNTGERPCEMTTTNAYEALGFQAVFWQLYVS